MEFTVLLMLFFMEPHTELYKAVPVQSLLECRARAEFEAKYSPRRPLLARCSVAKKVEA